MTSTAIGFVGLGRMGVPMARRLIEAGHAVQGFDLDPRACTRYAREAGTDAAGDLAAAAAGAATVITMLPDSEAVERALLEDGLLDALDAGARVIDMSSSRPDSTRALARTLGERGHELLDAPVSGGVRGAEAGTLTIMVGGPTAAFEACEPLLRALGDDVLHVGDVGSGHATKAINNALMAATLLASAEALAVGTRFGVDPEVLVDAINRCTGRSLSTELKLPKYVLTESYDSGFALRLLVKDLGIASGLGEESPLAKAVREQWEEAAAALPPDADHTEIARWIEERTGEA